MTGSVKFTLTDPKSYKLIKVRLYGEAYVHWTKQISTSGGDTITTVHFTENEPVVDQTVVLWKSEDTPNGNILNRGLHIFPFQFTIPPHCPSSFQESLGSIYHYVVGYIQTGFIQFDQRINVPLQIRQVLNINQPRFLAPIRETHNRQIYCLCCMSGNVEYTVVLPRRGFCINGECVPLSVTVNNRSRRRVRMRAAIWKLATFSGKGRVPIANGQRSVEENAKCSRDSIIAKASSETILPYSFTTWNLDNLAVPLVQISVTSRIISIEYVLKVWAVVPFTTNSYDPCIIPIVLGNVPYRGTPETGVNVTAPLIGCTSDCPTVASNIREEQV